MKKISLKNLNLKEVEQLSREQLKSVLGGMTGSGGTGSCNGCENKSDGAACNRPGDCRVGKCKHMTTGGLVCYVA